MLISLCPGIVHSIMVIVDCLLCYALLIQVASKFPPRMPENSTALKLFSPLKKDSIWYNWSSLPRWPPLQLSAGIVELQHIKHVRFFRVNGCLRPLRFQKQVGDWLLEFSQINVSNEAWWMYSIYRYHSSYPNIELSICLYTRISYCYGGNDTYGEIGMTYFSILHEQLFKAPESVKFMPWILLFYLYWYHCIYICTVMCLYHGYMVSFVWFFSLHRYTQTIIASMHFKSELRKIIADFSCNSKHHPKASTKKGQPSTPCEYLLEQQGHKTSSS